jgi:carboxypeptidase Taq
LWDKAILDLPTLPAQIERGEFAELLQWLRANLHQHARKFTLDELARKITGEPLQTRSWMRYLKTKFGEMYGV